MTVRATTLQLFGLPKMSGSGGWGCWQGGAPKTVFASLPRLRVECFHAFHASSAKSGKSAGGNELNFRAHVQMYRMCNGSAPACTLNASLSQRERERDGERLRGREGVCVCVRVSTCYIIKRGGRERCLACHTTATHFGRRGRDGSVGAQFHNPRGHSRLATLKQKYRTERCWCWSVHDGARGSP